MTAHFLGTGASPSMPIPFCTCRECVTARACGGKNLRRRSALLVDDELLIDFGPDVAAASFDQHVSLDRLRWCLQTHAHSDHFDPVFLASRHPEWRTRVGPLVLVASGATIDAMDTALRHTSSYGSLRDAKVREALRLALAEAAPSVPMTVGPYRVMPYPAEHAPDQGALLYSVDDGRRALFYGTDTAAIPDGVWRDMLARRAQYDLVVLDHTYGVGARGSDHLCADDVAELAARFRRHGILREGGTVYATHLSHEGILEHAQLEQYASRHGYAIAHDGMTLTL